MKSNPLRPAPGGAQQVVLHTCCAPCSSAIIEWMLQQGIRPVVFFSNPNIYPDEEYLRRKSECMRYVDQLGLEMVDDDHVSHADWLKDVGSGYEMDPERGRRCVRCFEYRLVRTAQFALKRGIPVFTTTLASSRWKNLDQVTAAGMKAAETVGHGATYWIQNWRKGGLVQRRAQIVEEMQFYRQPYCGCEFSLRDVQHKQQTKQQQSKHQS